MPLFREFSYLKRCQFKPVTMMSTLRPSSLSHHTPTNNPNYLQKAMFTQVSLSSIGVDFIGPHMCYRNLSYGEMMDHEAVNKDGVFTNTGAFSVLTGKFTGRSPLDRYIVQQEPSEKDIWWGDINRPISPEVYDILEAKVINYYRNNVKSIYVFDGFCGASENPKNRKKVRFITEKAWHHHFVSNMFIRPTEAELADFGEPDFTVINCYGLTDDQWQKHGLNSEVFGVMNIEKNLGFIGGKWYGGEMKKGIFSLMNYWLPKENNCLSMHCSANVGASGDTCIFFGLSGTGKTTLSTDAERKLIGDDEHGWDDDGVFNFEGGCYAKTINLSPKTEPEIYDAVKAGALLENVWVDPVTREIDYFNIVITENGRVSYPLEHILNREETKRGPIPKYIIFLTCDAFGVLPPISRLNSKQAMYHFVSGYTAKVAGTERGIVEPVPHFSPCYGAAFLLLHPMEYARLFQEKVEALNVPCFLVNTGWTGGPYGIGKRMSIKTTRQCINSIFDGSINNVKYRKDKVFHFDVPVELPNLKEEDCSILNPRNTWEDEIEYDEQYEKLAQLYANNFDKYVENTQDYQGFGPINEIRGEAKLI